MEAVSYTHLDVYKRQIIDWFDSLRLTAVTKSLPEKADKWLDVYKRQFIWLSFCLMDIILEFYIRNHSGIDLHDTDIDFFRPCLLYTSRILQ